MRRSGAGAHQLTLPSRVIVAGTSKKFAASRSLGARLSNEVGSVRGSPLE
jgi:hypothetical protein